MRNFLKTVCAIMYTCTAENCQAISTPGRFPLAGFSDGKNNKTGGVFNSAYLMTAEPGHVIWINFKIFETQAAAVKV